MLSLGLGHQLALQTKPRKLDLRNGAGIIVKDSAWSGNSNENIWDVLVYGTAVQVHGGQASLQMCRNLSPVPLTSALLFCDRLAWKDDYAVVDGWLNIRIPLADFQVFQSLRPEFHVFLERVSQLFLVSPFFWRENGAFSWLSSWTDLLGKLSTLQ